MRSIPYLPFVFLALCGTMSHGLSSVCAQRFAGRESPALVQARHRMVEEEVAGAGIDDARICAAMEATPRHLFVPESQRRFAYYDMALPIGSGQTISPPFVVAMMTQSLAPRREDRVLEIGTGSGYQAAVLSHLVADVYSIEIVPELGRSAARVLKELNFKNVHTKIGDGFQGWPEHAPFDKIIVTCSPERIPQPLVEQLAEGGMLVIPLGERYQQTLYRFRKVGGQLQTEILESTFFVPMTGKAEAIRRDADDWGIPRLVNGDFEAKDQDGLPLGWYYVRQGKVISESTASGNRRFLQFSNTTPGRGAQALQALGIDGRQVRKLTISLQVRTDQVRPGQSPKSLPRVALNFFDEGRAAIRTETLGPWSGSTPWTRYEQELAVPGRCRLAVLAVGMFGAVGQFSIDEVTLHIDSP